MRFSHILVAAATLISSAVGADDQAMDLGSVLSRNKDLSEFYGLIQKYPEVLLQLPSYRGITIIAPSNKAFKNIPYTALNDVWDPDNKASTVPLLQYHFLKGTVSIAGLKTGISTVRPTLLTNSKFTNVTEGQVVLLSKQSSKTTVLTSSEGTRCTITNSDITFQGGLIQVVDNLLIPPAHLSDTSQSFLVPDFLGALYAADLMPGLDYQKNITVFVPQNAAVDRVAGYLQSINKTDLARVLKFHVIPDQVLVSSTFNNGTQLATMAHASSNSTDGAPEMLEVTVAGNSKYVGSAQIVQPDILIANGIMHIISNVLNPDSDVQPNPAVPTQPPVFPVSTASGAFTSELPCSIDCPIISINITSTPMALTTTASSAVSTSSSGDAAAPARCTGRVLGAAAGLIGMGAGMVLF